MRRLFKTRGAARGGENVVGGGVVDHGVFEFTLQLQRDTDAVMRQTVDEVGRAVDWIHNPACRGFFW